MDEEEERKKGPEIKVLNFVISEVYMARMLPPLSPRLSEKM